MKAARMRGPDLRLRRIKGDGLGIGHVVANLRGFAAANDGGGNVEGADGEFCASKYFNLFAIFLAALLGLALCIAPLIRRFKS